MVTVEVSLLLTHQECGPVEKQEKPGGMVAFLVDDVDGHCLGVAEAVGVPHTASAVVEVWGAPAVELAPEVLAPVDVAKMHTCLGTEKGGAELASVGEAPVGPAADAAPSTLEASVVEEAHLAGALHLEEAAGVFVQSQIEASDEPLAVVPGG